MLFSHHSFRARYGIPVNCFRTAWLHTDYTLPSIARESSCPSIPPPPLFIGYWHKLKALKNKLVLTFTFHRSKTTQLSHLLQSILLMGPTHPLLTSNSITFINDWKQKIISFKIRKNLIDILFGLVQLNREKCTYLFYSPVYVVQMLRSRSAD